jgi:hypothetical protein
MNRLLLTLAAAFVVGACGTTASDTSLNAENGGTAGAAAQPEGAQVAAPVSPADGYVTITAGTPLALALTNWIASDTSTVEDAVMAELTRPITIGGREVLPAGAQLTGVVTDVGDSRRVTGRAMIAIRFSSLRTGDERYDVRTAPLTYLAPVTASEDATTTGIGAGAVGGGVLGGKGGADKGAAIGGGRGTGGVLGSDGQEVRLPPGADVSTSLTAPLSVRPRVY